MTSDLPARGVATQGAGYFDLDMRAVRVATRRWGRDNSETYSNWTNALSAMTNRPSTALPPILSDHMAPSFSVHPISDAIPIATLLSRDSVTPIDRGKIA